MNTLPRNLFGILLIILLTGCVREGDDSIRISQWMICNCGGQSVESGQLRDVCRSHQWLKISENNSLPDNVQFDESLWIRGSVVLKDKLPGRYGIVIRGRNRADKLYFNSILLEKTGAGKPANIYSPECYAVPGNCIRAGKNEILVRPGRGSGLSGIVKKISIMEGRTWDEELLICELVYTQIPLAIMIFNLSLIFPLLIFYMLNRKIRMLGFSSLVLVMFIVFTGFLFIPARYSGTMVPEVHLALMPFFGFFMVKSLQSLNRVNLHILNRILFAVSVVSSMIVLCLNKRIPEIIIPYALMAGLWVTITISVLILYESKGGQRDTVNSIVAILFIALTTGVVVWEVLFFFINGSFMFLSLIYSSPVFVILYIIILARDYMRSMAGMGELSRAIRDFEKRKNREPTITDLSEGKLEMIIDFIRKNYNREISREGLACAIGMSTDYMSRLFKKYTGKKLSEYINEMRIHEAESRLSNGNIKIIDIALSVGFESLPTFNRVFKNLKGISPSRYRRKANRPH